MFQYRVTFSLEGENEDARPDVRMWIDDYLAAGLGEEQEVRLERLSETDWQAGFEAPAGAFLYRIGVAGAPGSEWYLRIEDARSREVCSDGDVLALPKEWVVGNFAW